MGALWPFTLYVCLPNRRLPAEHVHQARISPLPWYHLFLLRHNMGVDVSENVYCADVLAGGHIILAISSANIGWKLFSGKHTCSRSSQYTIIGLNYYVTCSVFIILSDLRFTALYFILPETKRLPLEEVENILRNDPNAIAILRTSTTCAKREIIRDEDIEPNPIPRMKNTRLLVWSIRFPLPRSVQFDEVMEGK